MKKIALFLGIALTLAACYEDKGNYDYSELNDITIDLGNTQFTAAEGETISITPVLTFALDSTEANLSYEWNLDGRVISTDRNLSWVVDTTSSQSRCYYRVLDGSTGVTYLAYTSFQLTDKYDNQGWMILSEKDGSSSFSYIREDASGASYVENPDVFAEMNGEPLGGKPVGLLEHFYYNSTSSNIWVLLDGAETVDLSGRSFKTDVTLSESFLDGAVPANFTPLAMAEMRYFSAVINAADHKVYTRKKVSDRSYFTGAFLDEPLQYEGKDIYANDFIIAPFMGPGYTLMLEGEKGHQRYLALTSYGSDKANAGKILPLTPDGGSWPAGYKDLNNLGDMEVVYTGYNRYQSNSMGNNQYFSIMKDPSGNYWWQDFVIEKMGSLNTLTVYPGKSLQLDLGLPIDDNTIFYATPYSGSTWFLIAIGNDLYIIDRENINAQAASYVIKYMTFDSPITALDAECYNSLRLGVGLENGQFFVLNLGSTLPTTEAEKVRYKSTNTFGKIVDIRYKIRTGNQWQR